MNVAVVLGTRPEIVKMSPIIKELERKRIDHFTIHSGQHYSYNMDKVFFEQLGLPRPDFNLKVGSGSHAEETAKILVGIEEVLTSEDPDVVLVEGDTNTVLGAALAASKLSLALGHVEAGLRSYDRTMPEETNRIVTDHISDYLFAPTKRSRKNLLEENIDPHRIFVTGNTVVDVIYKFRRLAKKKEVTMLVPEDEEFALLTLHRQENVDSPSKLKEIIDAIELIVNELGLTVIFPIHPRTRARMKRYQMKTGNSRIKVVDPLDYAAFLSLESKAKLILTDSGGVQEEACILRVPCVTLRENTERPETVEVGANAIAGSKKSVILNKAKLMLSRRRNWPNPFGDGRSAERIVRILSSTERHK